MPQVALTPDSASAYSSTEATSRMERRMGKRVSRKRCVTASIGIVLFSCQVFEFSETNCLSIWLAFAFWSVVSSETDYFFRRLPTLPDYNSRSTLSNGLLQPPIRPQKLMLLLQYVTVAHRYMIRPTPRLRSSVNRIPCSSHELGRLIPFDFRKTFATNVLRLGRGVVPPLKTYRSRGPNDRDHFP